MRLFANNASSTLASPISNSALSMTVASGEGARFPSPGAGDYFNITLCKVTSGIESEIEIVKVTARSGDIFTIQRAQEGTTAVAHASGDFVGMRVTAATMNEHETHVTSKDKSGGFPGLTAFKINFLNALGTFTSFFTNANTASRTYTFQDRDGVIADNTDLAAKANLVSPSFTTPTLGVASATTLNKISFTPPATGSTITIVDAKTLTVSNTLTFAGTDGSTLNIGAGGTLGSAAFTASSAYATAAQGTLATNALPSASFTDAAVSGKLITGFSAAAGTVAASDTILGAFNKIVGNIGLKANLSGGNTFTGTQIMSDAQVTRAMLIDSGYTFLDKGNSSTTAQTIDFTAGHHQKITATGNHSFAFSNWPPTGNTGFILFEATNYGAYTITPPTVNWVNPDGTTTTSLATHFTALSAVGGRSGFKSSGTDFMMFWSRDAGTTVYGKFL